jgi:hypothetical protein
MVSREAGALDHSIGGCNIYRGSRHNAKKPEIREEEGIVVVADARRRSRLKEGRQHSQLAAPPVCPATFPLYRLPFSALLFAWHLPSPPLFPRILQCKHVARVPCWLVRLNPTIMSGPFVRCGRIPSCFSSPAPHSFMQLPLTFPSFKALVFDTRALLSVIQK